VFIAYTAVIFHKNKITPFLKANNLILMFILREVFSDKFKCMSLDNLDFLVMFYLEHKDTILVHYVDDTFEESLHYYFFALQNPNSVGNL
jgi:hypothetical protein